MMPQNLNAVIVLLSDLLQQRMQSFHNSCFTRLIFGLAVCIGWSEGMGDGVAVDDPVASKGMRYRGDRCDMCTGDA